MLDRCGFYWSIERRIGYFGSEADLRSHSATGLGGSPERLVGSTALCAKAIVHDKTEAEEELSDEPKGAERG